MPKAQDGRTPKVIGAGLGRTGTASTKRALEQLGFGPCHHMEEVFVTPEDTPTWERAARGEPVDWPTFLRGWGSAVDFPAALHYKALMEAFPDAKVLLTVRDAQGWYRSFTNTIYAMTQNFPNRYVINWLPRVSSPRRVLGDRLFERMFQGRFEDEAFMLRWFDEYTAEVQRVVPADRLLVFDVKQGWGPLCAWLGVPVPDGPFPRVNDTAEFQKRVRIVTAVCWVVLLAPVALVLAVLAAVYAVVG